MYKLLNEMGDNRNKYKCMFLHFGGEKNQSDRQLRTYYSYVRDWEYVFLLEYWYINLTQ